MQVPLRVSMVQLDPRDGRAVLLFVHEASGRVFPLWIGDQEAASVVRALEGATSPRPDAHDLMANIVRGLGAQVQSVELTGVVGGVVVAEVVLCGADEPILIEARPSDAVALALRAQCPILVEEELLEQVAARVREAEARVGPARGSSAAEPVMQSAAERWNQLLEHLGGARQGQRYES